MSFKLTELGINITLTMIRAPLQVPCFLMACGRECPGRTLKSAEWNQKDRKFGNRVVVIDFYIHLVQTEPGLAF